MAISIFAMRRHRALFRCITLCFKTHRTGTLIIAIIIKAIYSYKKLSISGSQKSSEVVIKPPSAYRGNWGKQRFAACSRVMSSGAQLCWKHHSPQITELFLTGKLLRSLKTVFGNAFIKHAKAEKATHRGTKVITSPRTDGCFQPHICTGNVGTALSRSQYSNLNSIYFFYITKEKF